MKNEREVMESLGLRQVAGSGNGWVSKEDGENEHVLCQLKSTDKKSYSVKKEDIDTLEQNAAMSHKIPVFAVQFLGDNATYLLVSPENLQELARYLNTGSVQKSSVDWGTAEPKVTEDTPQRTATVRSGGRERYMARHDREREKKKRSAR